MPATAKIIDEERAASLEERRRLAAWAIKAARDYRRMSRSRFAQRISEGSGESWSVSMVGKIERGEKTVGIELLGVIAEILDFDLGFFVYGPSGGGPRNTDPSGVTVGYPQAPDDLLFCDSAPPTLNAAA